MLRNAAVVLAVMILGAPARAQSVDTASRAPEDTVISRAKQLARDGHDTDGRRLIDSVLATLTPDSSRYGEALYWRGALAATAADAERDYRRLLIEAPLTPRAEDALLQLAQLEQARGDRRGASDHLQRYLLSYPQGASRAKASVQLVRLLFDQGPQQLARACDALKSAKVDVPASNVELRNQLEAQESRCAYVDVQPAASASTDSAASPAAASTPDTAKPAVPVAPIPAPSSTPASAAPAAAPLPAAPSAPSVAPAAAVSFYSVQLAAYDSQDAANRMVGQLVGRGVDARVDGAKAPYRVRVGRYQTRAEAVKAAADLKAKGHNGFITLVSPSPK